MIVKARAISRDTAVIERRLPGPLERVWEYLTSPDLLPTWFAEGAIAERVGALVRLSQDSPRVPYRSLGLIQGTVTRCIRPRLLELTWQHVPEGATADPTKETLVRFELDPHGDQVVLRITHSHLPSDGLPGYLSGWEAHTNYIEAAMLGSAPESFMDVLQRGSAQYQLEVRQALTALDEVQGIYRRVLDAWNRQDARAYAAEFTTDGRVIGFDGSQMSGRNEIEASLASIFANHRTAAYVSIVREVREISPGAILLQAVAGMIPPGGNNLNPAVNAVQSLVATRAGEGWVAALFQNTPAALHGRPEESERLTAELRRAFSRT